MEAQETVLLHGACGGRMLLLARPPVAGFLRLEDVHPLDRSRVVGGDSFPCETCGMLIQLNELAVSTRGAS